MFYIKKPLPNGRGSDVLIVASELHFEKPLPNGRGSDILIVASEPRTLGSGFF